jgi:hypothetical protein
MRQGGSSTPEDVTTGASGFAGLTVSPGTPRPSTSVRPRPKWPDRSSHSASRHSICTETSIRATPEASALPSAAHPMRLMGPARASERSEVVRPGHPSHLRRRPGERLRHRPGHPLRRSELDPRRDGPVQRGERIAESQRWTGRAGFLHFGSLRHLASAGTPITVGLTALDQYQNVDTNYTGNECIAFSGASNAPDGTGASYPIPQNCGAGDSQVTFTAGLTTNGAAPSLTFYDSQLVDLLATDVPTPALRVDLDQRDPGYPAQLCRHPRLRHPDGRRAVQRPPDRPRPVQERRHQLHRAPNVSPSAAPTTPQAEPPPIIRNRGPVERATRPSPSPTDSSTAPTC